MAACGGPLDLNPANSPNSRDGEANCDDGLDADGDGLSECQELALGTALHLADTDGDGLSDGREVIELGFSVENNNYKFNPLIADTPRLRIDLVSAPKIVLLYETSEGSVATSEVTRSEESSTQVSTSQSSTNSRAVEVSVTEGVAVTAGAEVGLFKVNGKYEATVSYEQSVSTTQETSFSWSKEQQQENATGLAVAQSKAEEEGTALLGGELLVAVNVTNQGHLAYTIKNMAISAVMNTARGERLITPIGTLSYDTTQVVFPEFSLGPAQSQGPFIFARTDVPLATTEKLLRDSSSLSLRIAAYEVADPDGRSFTHNQTEISARTATILIDYDGTDNPFVSERYQVATNVDATRLRIGALEALRDVLRVPVETDPAGDLVAVRGVAALEELNARWTVVHETIDGVLPVLYQASAAEGSPFAEIELKSGDILQIIYIEDRDFDRMGTRQEISLGTDPGTWDTDGDTLGDGAEVWDFGTDPRAADSDGDGLDDPVEQRYGFDPWLYDSDDDGVWDPDEVIVDVGGFETLEFVNLAGEIWSTGQVALSGPERYFETTKWARTFLGNDHYLRESADGKLYGWGFDGLGATGTGGLPARDAIAPVATEVSFSAVVPGIQHTLAIDTGGGLWAWGGASGGQLGTEASDSCGTRKCAKTPVKVGSATWRSVAAGRGFGVGVQTDGTLWTWGNSFGSLADPNVLEPQQFGENTDWLEVSACDSFVAIALKSNGTLWSWGSTDGFFEPSLGLGLNDVPEDHIRIGAPTQIGSDTDWATVRVGYDHVLALKTDGTLWGWGESKHGELGVFADYVSAPTQIGSESNWTKIVAAQLVSVALNEQGVPYVWGNDLFSRLNRTPERADCGLLGYGCSAVVAPIAFQR